MAVDLVLFINEIQGKEESFTLRNFSPIPWLFFKYFVTTSLYNCLGIQLTHSHPDLAFLAVFSPARRLSVCHFNTAPYPASHTHSCRRPLSEPRVPWVWLMLSLQDSQWEITRTAHTHVCAAPLWFMHTHTLPHTESAAWELLTMCLPPELTRR